MHRFLIALAILALALTACAGQMESNATADQSPDEPAAVENPEAVWAAGNNRFGGDVFLKLAAAQPADNLCFSPISAYLAFGVLYPGAVGEAHDEIGEVLHFDMPEQQVNETSLAMLRRYAETDTTLGVIELANSAWYQQDYPIEADYLATVKQYYAAAFEPCDFLHDADGERVRINAWAAEQTHGRIPEPLPPQSLSNTSRLVLVNATYLKQFWLSAFDGGMTMDRAFYLASGEKVDTSTMHAERRVMYREEESFQSIELPYKDTRFSMLFVLPTEVGHIDALATTFSADGLDGFVPEEGERHFTKITLPKFEFTNDFELNKPLQELGMKRAFAPGGAFRKICKSDDLLYVDVVLQSTFIKVDEEGTEAAAVTVIVMNAMSVAPQPAKVFHADHPFLFFLRDIDTGAVLFMGRVMNPGME